MDRIHELEVFVAVAEAGSFAKAAVRLRLSPPAVTRAISGLEDRLGERVFNRTTRSLVITDVGQRFLESAKRILTDLHTAEMEAIGGKATPHGKLTVTASVTFGRSALAPILFQFIDQYPQVHVSALLVDRVVNLVEEGIDAAVRIGRLPDSNLVARKLGTVRRVLVASPDYLRRRGTPVVPADLNQHSLIAFSGLTPNREWRLKSDKGSNLIALDSALEVNDAVVALQAAEAGHGIAIALSYMVADKVREGKLVPVLEDFGASPIPVHLVYAQARLIAPKIRAFVDFAAPRLKIALDDMVLPHPTE